MSGPAQRLSTLKQHLVSVSENPTRSLAHNKHDDVVIISARRTAVCKARRGAFKVCLFEITL